MKSKITHLGIANPSLQLNQDEIWKLLLKNRKLSEKEKVFYKRFLADSSVKKRYFGLVNIDEIFSETPQDAVHRFEREAVAIGADALKHCIEAASLTPTDIDALIVTTCTGYLCPGLSTYISESAGCREDLIVQDIVGLGCGAAIPALRAADYFLKAHPDKKVVVLAVEVCTATIFWGEEIDLMLSNAIFADGAAAALLSQNPGARGVEIDHFESLLWPEFRDDLRFKNRDLQLCNVISKDVPKIAAQAVKQLHDQLPFSRNGHTRHYAIHPGGRKVLDAIQQEVQLSDTDLAPSRSILENFGNMSSPSVLFVLNNIMNNGVKADDEISLFAFGAGFTAFTMFGRYQEAQ